MNIIIILVLLLFIIIGSVLLIKGFNDKNKCTATTIGKIVDIERQHNEGVHRNEPMHGHGGIGGYEHDHISLYPIFEYEVNGKKYVKKSSSSSSTKNYYIGEETTIYYDPSNPEHSFLQGSSTNSIILGVVFIIVPLIFGIMYIFF